MKPKLILCLALVLSGGLFWYSATAQSPAKHDQWHGFPVLPAITNADPTIIHPISIRVPTKLKIERTADMLSVEIDTNSFESTNLMVGTNMIVGVESQLYVDRIEAGVIEPRPNGGFFIGKGWGFFSGTDFNLGKTIWHAEQEGIPLPGRKYVVEWDLKIFETDIPPQHEWFPYYGEKNKVLWQRTLKQTVE
jgi:hypothetical protein